MGFVSLALTAFATTADAIGVGTFIADKLSKRDGTTGADLFSKCFTTAVKRLSTDLGEVAQIIEDEQGVSIDPGNLKGAVQLVDQGDVAQFGVGKDGILDSLVPLFRSSVVLRGIKLTHDALDRFVRRVLDASLEDFFTRLPTYPRAMAETELRHIVSTRREHQSQQDTLVEILSKVDAHQQDVRSTSTYLDATVIQQESSRPEHRNPFRIVKAEDFDHDYDRLARLFREPSYYDDIRGKDNLIIAGGRGCGKSMILRSMSAGAAVNLQQLRRNQPAVQPPKARASYAESGLDYFGVYIKLARGYFYEWAPDCKLSKDGATILFQHVFNMLLLDSLVDALSEARSSHLLDIETHIEESIVRDLDEVLGTTSASATFRDFRRVIRQQQQHVAQYLGNLRLGIESASYSGRHTYIHDFMDACCAIVRTRILALGSSRVFFLLDEYENLATFQQQVVNTLAKLRPTTLTLKIATRALGVKSVTDLQGEPIQRPRDYQVIALDYSVRDKQFSDLLLEIGRKRLSSEGFAETDLRKLLPPAPDYHPSTRDEIETALRGFLTAQGADPQDLQGAKFAESMHLFDEAMVFRASKVSKSRQPRTYASFDDFVHLSSGIISNFLELCKLALYIAEGEGFDVRSGVAVPYEVQSRAVYLTSQASLDWIARNIENTGPAISRLTLDLADIFREKLLHRASEPEAARIVITDPARLDENKALSALLDDAVRWSVLHASGQANAYFPKHKSETRSDDYYLNRILAPILRLSSRPRWRTRFSTSDLAKLLDESTRSETRRRLIKTHAGQPRKRASSGRRLFLDELDGSEGKEP